ncbi:5'-nucleotidase domain-containing protein 3 isoform X1 [Neodiprion pinetum]|uniref:5'-nucleotidase domain-containing protein 3 isoform X2 n=1 Tax=Neodiprion lecontei TaxID=441921 RepID=A0ABM3FWT3_NEOLC|nr:5'-nucleotidase domain-containing protein 3 isoform X2 [Neodiprion pinetum]XP_046592478.1 5'-nucleotidase domain-containing protein 3 isoform X2 [Neodiprion lecontei]XP_046613797.1 5'-nucleotidase domain-containing protein 3 isoform X2 [Neodiprion virginianus]
MFGKATVVLLLSGAARNTRYLCRNGARKYTQQPGYSHRKISRETMRQNYLNTKAKCESKKLPLDVNANGVFACNELDLEEVQVYGFDYDYTLACYKPSMDYLLYNLGRDMLIQKYKYPEEIGKLEYPEGFAVRGLHYDIEKGLLLKLDSFLQIQLGTVYRGLQRVPDEEVLRLYKNRIIPIAYVEAPNKHTQDPRSTKMVQLADLFSVPEMGLLCNVAEYFVKNHIDYHPEILFRDVKNSVQSCHPIMHQTVVKNVGDFLEKNKDMRKFFDRLKSIKKKMFLVTNSPFPFVNVGMKFLLGEDWKDYFDVVIVQARKPRFFTDETRPLRIYDEKKHTLLWDRVTKLEKGTIYLEGTVKQLQDMTGWRGHQVLYFGDHPYSDLADVTLEHGWRTGAIITELTHEIDNLNDPEFKKNANWLQMLTALIEDHQDYEGKEAKVQLNEWMRERDNLRNDIKRVFNQQFGSVFRTYHNPTYFSRRLFRFADIYMSNITNLLNYSTTHTFYPRRGVMPHEYTNYFV